MRGIVRGITIGAAVALGASLPAKSDELAMPYLCSVENGAVELRQSPEIVYKISDARDDQPFSWCGRQAGARCETMMVHRFQLMCGGERVAWAKVADAARRLGIKLPEGLPNGYAPVSLMAGRFILPSLVSVSGPHVAPLVTSETLSPDSVTPTADARIDETPRVEAATWRTDVSADVIPGGERNAGRVAAALGGALALLAAATLLASGRVRLTAGGDGFGAPKAGGRTGGAIGLALRRARAALNRAWESWREGGLGPLDAPLANAIAAVYARLAETQLKVAMLTQGLLLHDVLQTEIDRVRDRLAAAEKDVHRRGHEKTAAITRALLRELDRIERIAQSAAASSASGEHRPSQNDMPSSPAEAYRILGINPDAAPAVAKKLIDALRMSWHPDHARDDEDRLKREERMKQINAAWDLIKDRRAVA